MSLAPNRRKPRTALVWATSEWGRRRGVLLWLESQEDFLEERMGLLGLEGQEDSWKHGLLGLEEPGNSPGPTSCS